MQKSVVIEKQYVEQDFFRFESLDDLNLFVEIFHFQP